MITVTIELHSAVTGKKTIIGRMNIWNRGAQGGSTEDLSNYNVGVCRRGTHADELPTYTRTGHVNNYPRLRYNVWRLVARALMSAFPEERKNYVRGENKK